MASVEGDISLGPWGGLGGDPWIFRASSAIIEITINVDTNVKAISFKDDEGYVSGTFGGNNSDYLGEERKIFINWPIEFVTAISGSYGNDAKDMVITSLTLTTNLDTYGPFGKTGGYEFSIPIEDSFAIGFHGRCGDFLDAIGIFVQPIYSNGSISLGPWGGGGGSPFNFKTETWIKEITIFDGQCIVAIAFKDANGNEYGKFGGGDPKEHGVKRTIEINGPSEYLTSITGTYGTHNYPTPVITSLSLVTNQTTHGPFGNANGTSFSIPIQGSLVNGFHGRGAGFLDAIGIFVKPEPTI